ncbi:MAG: hypothetical protein AAF602_18175, partial [Myxococcota bacterium]
MPADPVHLLLPPGDLPDPAAEGPRPDPADALLRVDDVVPRRLVRPPERGRPELESHPALPDDIVEIEDQDGVLRIMTAADYATLDETVTRGGGAELGIKAVRVVRIASRKVAELLDIDEPELEKRLEELALDKVREARDEVVERAVQVLFRPLLIGLENLRAHKLGARDPGPGAGTLFR